MSESGGGVGVGTGVGVEVGVKVGVGGLVVMSHAMHGHAQQSCKAPMR